MGDARLAQASNSGCTKSPQMHTFRAMCDQICAIESHLARSGLRRLGPVLPAREDVFVSGDVVSP